MISSGESVGLPTEALASEGINESGFSDSGFRALSDGGLTVVSLLFNGGLTVVWLLLLLI